MANIFETLGQAIKKKTDDNRVALTRLITPRQDNLGPKTIQSIRRADPRVIKAINAQPLQARQQIQRQIQRVPGTPENTFLNSAFGKEALTRDFNRSGALEGGAQFAKAINTVASTPMNPLRVIPKFRSFQDVATAKAGNATTPLGKAIYGGTLVGGSIALTRGLGAAAANMGVATGAQTLAGTAKIVGSSAALGGAMGGIGGALSGQNIGKSALAGAEQGVKYAPTYQLTNLVVGKIAQSIPALKPLTDAAIEGNKVVTGDTVRQALLKTGDNVFKRAVKAAFIETPFETVMYGFGDRREGEKLIDGIAREFRTNLIFNLGFAGVNSIGDAAKTSQIVNKSMADALEKTGAYKLLTTDNRGFVQIPGSDEFLQKAAVKYGSDHTKSINLKQKYGEIEGLKVGELLNEVEAIGKAFDPNGNPRNAALVSRLEEIVKILPKDEKFQAEVSLQALKDATPNAKSVPEIDRTQLTGAQLSTPSAKLTDPQVTGKSQLNTGELQSPPVLGKQKKQKLQIEYNRGPNGELLGASVSPTRPQVVQARDLSLQEPIVNTKEANSQFNYGKNQMFKQEGAVFKTKTEVAANTIKNAINENTNSAIKRELKPVESILADSSQAWKDKPILLLNRETPYRNFEDVMGKDAPETQRVYLDPIGKAEAERTRWVNSEKKQIADLGIKANSKESGLVQEYGEKLITLDELKKRTPNWQKIVNAENVFRQKYDNYLETVNKVLVKNGYDAIPKRKDYYRHFSEISEVFERFGIPAKVDSLPTDINGLTADFKPGKAFFASALPRLGEKTKIDAVSGIDKYIDGVSRQIFHTDNIQRLRALDQLLRDQYAGTEHLSNFVANLTETTNQLAGKKSMFDRGLEQFVGRGIYNSANKLRQQFGANAVGGNVSSALTNYIPLTQALATTNKQAFVKGMLDTISSTFKDDGLASKSDFLTRRLGTDRLAMGLWDQVGDKAGWLFKTIDRFTSETIVRSKYYEGLQKGLDPSSALDAADKWAARIMADRSVGQMPTLFGSKTLGFLTQFQLEVNNQLSFALKDIPRNYNKAGAASALAQLFLYGYIFNNIFEQIVGRRPALDPIGVAQQAYEDYTNQNMKKGQATTNFIKNASAQLPFTDIITGGGRIPLSGVIPDVIGVLTGKADAGKEFGKLAYGTLLPAGGQQIRKTIEGLKAYNKGASVTDKGAVRYPIEQNPINAIRTGVFGQYSTPEARKYFREGQNVLGEKQSQTYLNLPNSQQVEYYDRVMSERAIKNIQKELKAGEITQDEAAKQYAAIGNITPSTPLTAPQTTNQNGTTSTSTVKLAPRRKTKKLKVKALKSTKIKAPKIKVTKVKLAKRKKIRTAKLKLAATRKIKPPTVSGGIIKLIRQPRKGAGYSLS